MAVVSRRWRPAAAYLIALLLGTCVASGCAAPVRQDPVLDPVSRGATAALGLPATDYRSDNLLRGADGRCGGQRAHFGGRPEDGADVSLRLVRFRDRAAAAWAVATLDRTALAQLLGDRIAMPLVPANPDRPLPPEVVAALAYGSRLVPAERAATGLTALPVSVLLVQAGPVVALVESLGLAPEAEQRLAHDLVGAVGQLPERDCWGWEPSADDRQSEGAAALSGLGLLLLLTGVMVLPIVALATGGAARRRQRALVGLLWLGTVLVLVLWLVPAR